MKTIMAILVTITFISCARNTFNRGTLIEWSKFEATNDNTNIDAKGNNSTLGYVLIEKKSKKYPNARYLEYYLSKPNGDSLKLNFEVNGSMELMYFEFYDHNLFVMINQADLTDKVLLYNIDAKTGDIYFQRTGQLPCVSNFEFDWKIGNKDCEWMDFKDGKIALAHMDLNFLSKSQLVIYSWRVNELNIIDTGLNIFLSADHGYIIRGNVCYKSKTSEFQYVNDSDYKH